MASSQKRSLRLEKGSWRLETRTTAGSLLVIALLGLLSWLCLIQASKVSTAKYRIWEKEVEIGRLQRENAESLAEVVEMLSVSRLEGRALELGYISAEDRRYLDVPGYPGGVSGGGLAAAPRMDENAVVALEEPRGEPPGVVRWWEKVVSQFVTWGGTQP
ncbi:MAG: hypothetical protein ISS50_05065 [Anaerolineae bacterium]|nr:hypothetical protein [Anaerolineae bacterium]